MKKKDKRITVIHADGRPDTVTEETAPSLGRLQELVGGYIESIPYFTKYNSRRVNEAYCNEDGKGLGLPANRKATAAWVMQHPTLDWLVGDVVLIQSIDKPKEQTT